ncbi:MAG: phosphodiesterase [Hyphomicrobiales bacterium]
MKFLQFTDIHLTEPGTTIAGRDPNANFEKALSHAMNDHGDSDAIVITGDLSDWGDLSDYQRLKLAIDKLPMPVYLCIGNHDDRENFARVFPDRVDETGHIQSVFELGNQIGICLDTKIEATHSGALCDKRLAWLDRKLEALSVPAFIFMHHNPVPTGQGPIDSIMLKNSVQFGDLVKRHSSKIRHIFFGHCHLPLCGSIHGIPISAPRGTNHAAAFNFAEPEMLSGANLPESYAVIWASDHTVMVDMIEFGYDGPYFAENTPDYDGWDRETMER